MTGPLSGKIALVAGATRGAGRGIARMLGEAGATVYCTGRSVPGQPSPTGRSETIVETAEMVTAAGGVGVAVQTDHSRPDQVEALFERVREESGRLDILVNDIGGEAEAHWERPWAIDIEKGFTFLDTAVRTHIVTTRYALPLMLEQSNGLIIEITDGDHLGYRGAWLYDLAKTQVIRIAKGLAVELAAKGITVIAVTPGFLRSEMMLDILGITEDNWYEAADREMGFSESETPCYVGRAVAALAADPNVHSRSGQVLASWTLAKEYGFKDIDGRQPDWIGFVERSLEQILDAGGPADDQERHWLQHWHIALREDPRWSDLMGRLAPLLEDHG